MDETLREVIGMQQACAKGAEEKGRPDFRKENSDGKPYCYLGNGFMAEGLERCADSCPHLNTKQLVRLDKVGGNYYLACTYENNAIKPTGQPETQPQSQQNP